MRHVILSALAAVGAISGCAASTGPKVSVGGTWKYEAQNLAEGGTVTCAVTNMTLTLTQTGSTFAGTYSGANADCMFASTHLAFALSSSGTIVDGRIDGDQVSFDMGDHLWSQTGAISGNSMNGNATITLNSGIDTLGSSVITVSGQWAAVKQ
jgi:hypothetical protein